MTYGHYYVRGVLKIVEWVIMVHGGYVVDKVSKFRHDCFTEFDSLWILLKSGDLWIESRQLNDFPHLFQDGSVGVWFAVQAWW